jgi:hypothetical protein
MIKRSSTRKFIMLWAVCLTSIASASGAKEHDITVDGDGTKPGYTHKDKDGQNGHVLVHNTESVVWTCGDKCQSMTITFSVTPCAEGSSFSGSPITCTINDSMILEPDKYTITVLRSNNTSTNPDDPYVIVDNQSRPPKKPKPPAKPSKP